MLLELSVENYAVVDRLSVRFHSGLNLLTGETGSGKSIVVGALGLLLGARSSPDVIRSGQARARIAGRFELDLTPPFASALEDAGIELEDGELVLEREIHSAGKSRVWVNSRPATAQLLKDLAPFLGDIHGQHDAQLLFEREAQRDMLDGFADAAALLTEVRERYRCWSAAQSELEELESGEQSKLRQLDLWQFQRQEIEAAELQPGEDAALEEERRVQANLGRLLESVGAAFAALYDSEEAAYPLLRSAAKKLDEMGRVDSALAAMRAVLEPALITVQEVSYQVRDYLGGLEANPERLEEIEGRLAQIDRLKRKYGSNVEEILAFLEDTRTRIDAVENAGERMAQLRRERDQHGAAYEKAAAKLTAVRREAARTLASAVEQELAPLAMTGARMRIELSESGWSEHGSDQVRFLISPNMGEEPKPLEKVASGGEISRIALALKTCLPSSAAARTLVFDEVDTGIGGSTAEAVGRRLKKLAAGNQVLCVTHLAQVASFADHHYRVEKAERDGRTVTQLEELSGAARPRELARMLSGAEITPDAVRHAEQMIVAARGKS